MEDYKFLYKIVLVGNAGVGKTCLVRRFTQVNCYITYVSFTLLVYLFQGVFPGGQGATIGVDFMIKTVTVNGNSF